MRIKTNIILLFLGTLFCWFTVEGQATSNNKEGKKIKQTLDQNLWSEKREDYLFEEKKEEKKKKNELPKQDEIINWSANSKNIGLLLLGLIYVTGIIGIVYLIYSQKKSKVNKVHDFAADHEQNLLESDIDALLRLAKEQNNYQQIIRFTFLALLKAMVEKNHLIWEKEFILRDFIRQLKNPETQLDFRKITTFYERKWFNNEISTAKDALLYEQKCQIFKSSLTNFLPTSNTNMNTVE
ncbi:MAG TPA: hypothetical protein PKD18_00655 [Saprospiraceae bacterium]|nr:hypothetical protein [Saprospiraceae bacterium]